MAALALFSTEAFTMKCAFPQNSLRRARHAGSPNATSLSGGSSRENSTQGSEFAKSAESFLSVNRVSDR